MADLTLPYGCTVLYSVLSITLTEHGRKQCVCDGGCLLGSQFQAFQDTLTVGSIPFETDIR